MKSRKKIGIIASLCLACSVFAVGGIKLSSSNNVNAATVENLYISEEYSLGKVFTIPNAQINVDGTLIDSEYSYLVFPSGKASDKSPIVLDEEGLYELVYTATVGGKKVKATENFVVSKQIYKVSNEKSSAYFGSHSSIPALEGVVVNLASGDEFVYDEIIDLSDNSASDSLISFSMFATTPGSADVSEMVIRLTDIYDENNYLSIYVKNVAEYGDWALRQAYITAGGNNQTPGGWENAPTGSKFHTKNEYGFPVKFTMAGTPYDSTMGYDLLTFAYDYSQNDLRVNNQIYPGDNIVAKFDDRDSYLDVWTGFTTGEVRMTISGVSYKSELMHFVISEIDGKAPERKINTDVAPIINIDALENNIVPYALVGREYAVFEAYAFDTHEGVKDVDVFVYYNYGQPNQVVCNVVDGKFIPKNVGTYTLVYTSRDGMNNVSERVINVEAYDHDGLSLEIVGRQDRGYTGKEIVLFEELVSQNVSGVVDYRVYVNGEELLPTNGQFVFMPTSDGTYTIKVIASDYIKETVTEYSFSTIKNYTPQIYSDILLPKYFIQGEQVKLPVIDGFDYSTGVQRRHDTRIFVKENGGEEVEITGNAYTPSQTGEIEIIYRVDVSGRKAEKRTKVQVVSVFEGENLRIDKYFRNVSGDAVMGAEDSFITVTANQDSLIEFINRVQVKDFNMTFVLSEEYNAVNKINIYLTDVLDPTKQLKFSYVKGLGGVALFSLNDGENISVEASFISSNKNFSLSFVDGKAYGSNIVYTAVNEYLDGREFEGFSNDFAYLTIEMEGVSNASVLCLKSLNRQSLNNANKDRFAPQILTNAIVGDRTVNDVIIISEALAADVLCTNWEFTLKMMAPDGSYVSAKDGTVLNGVDNDPSSSYEVVLSMYGEYFIEYCATDRFGRENFIAYYLNVKDSIDPVIKLGSATNTANVGDTITVAEATVTDNISEELTVFICVEDPDCKIIQVVDNKFVAEKAGVYTVRYMVWDEAGNYAFKSYTVTVK